MKKTICIMISVVFTLAFFSCASNPKNPGEKGAETLGIGTAAEESDGNVDAEQGDVVSVEGNAEVFDDSVDTTGDDLVEGAEDNREEYDSTDDMEGGGVKESPNEYTALDEDMDSAAGRDEDAPLAEERVFPDVLPDLPEPLDFDSVFEDDFSGAPDETVDEILDREADGFTTVEIDIIEDDGEFLEGKGIPPHEDDNNGNDNASDGGSQKAEALSNADEKPLEGDTAVDFEYERDYETNHTIDYANAEPSNALEETRMDGTSDFPGEGNEENKKLFDSLPKPSRSMTVKKGQTIEVVYPGRGWIYQESIDSEGAVDTRNRNFIFGGRKLGDGNQAFTLRPRNAGTYLLHFYKNDSLADEYIDDYLEVIVEDESEPSSKIAVAPSYIAAVPPRPVINAGNAGQIRESKKAAESKDAEEMGGDNAAAKSDFASRPKAQDSVAGSEDASQGTLEDSSVKTVVQTPHGNQGFGDNGGDSIAAEGADADSSGVIDISLDDEPLVEMSDGRFAATENADTLLKQAKEFFAAKDYRAALDATRRFLDSAAFGLDEGLFLQAQILESKSEVQDIRGAIDSYNEIVKNYPASTLWDAANRRSIYLRRFYIDIR